MFLMTFIILGVMGLLVWQGRSFVNTAIAQSPDVVAVHSDLKDMQAELVTAKDSAGTAKLAADDAKKSADDTAAKVDASQRRIFDALNEQRGSNEEIVKAIATLTERIAGVTKQLDRVESKQDSGK